MNPPPRAADPLASPKLDSLAPPPEDPAGAERLSGHVRFLLAGAGLLAATTVVFVPIFLDRSPEERTFSWLFALFTVVCGWPIARGMLRGRLNLFELPVWLTIEQWLRMGLFSVSIFTNPESIEPALVGAPGWINLALLYCVFSIVVLWLGYRSKLGEVLAGWRPFGGRAENRPVTGISIAGLLTLYGIVMLTRFYLIRAGAFGYLSTEETRGELTGALYIFGLLDVAGAIVVVALWLAREQFPRVRQLATVAFPVVLVLEFVSRFAFGFKGSVAYVFLALVIFDYRLRRRLWLFVPAGALILLFIIPVNYAYRSAFLDRSMDSTSVSSILGMLSELSGDRLATMGHAVETVGEGGNALLASTGQLQNFAAILKYVHDTGTVLYGEEWLKLPAILLIPRALWPDKPNYTLTGGWMTQEVLGYTNHQTATAVTMYGDFYVQFGLIGVLAGMFLLGVVLRVLYLRYGTARDARSELCYPFILLLVGPGMTVENGIGLIRMLLFLLIVSRLVFVRQSA